MIRRGWLLGGLLILAASWFVVPFLPFGPSFLGHMTMHLGVVAVAAPLLAIGVAGRVFELGPRVGLLCHPVLATGLEFVVVWGWHAPALHFAARTSALVFALEQVSFLVVGLMVWVAAFGVRQSVQASAAAGTAALFITSMHMTLLGALLALSPRPLYDPSICGFGAFSPLEDQQLGGVLMLMVGGASYLIGGLVLMARLLRAPEGAGT
ncbi:MAG: cytochrome c oxidase assembly protein [Geminicoccaceae bacterium]|nr:cytochrome c oxidase assembly protein [Geminicoccaceae bacterium]